MAQTGGNRKVNAGFHTAFPEASNVSWNEKKAFVVISFTECSQPVQAYFDYDGNRIAVTRNVRFNGLTLPALSAIQKKYTGYKYVGGVEMNHAIDGHSYYVSLQKDSRRVILRVSLDGDLKIFKTLRVTDIQVPAFALSEDMQQ